MKWEKLGNVAEIIAGQSPPSVSYNTSGDGLPFFQGKADYGEMYPSIRFYCASPQKISNPGDILISVRAPVGPVNLNNVKACIGRGLSAIRVKNTVSRDYIFLWLKNNQEKIAAKGTGTTFKAITQSKLVELILPLPSFEDQLHIAHLLTQAETLIARRKESIRLLDEYLKSVFLEMFGDPVRNEKGFQKVAFGDHIIEIKAGSSYGGEQSDDLHDDEMGVLKVSAVTWGTFNPKEFKVVKKVHLRGETISPLKGDLLFSRANTRELVGATCLVDADYPKLFLPDKLWKLRLNRKILRNDYIHFLFSNNSFKQTLTREASGTSGSMLNISMDKLRRIKIPLPEMVDQITFSNVRVQTEILKSQYRQSLQELENLYGSLSQRAFGGGINQITTFDD